MIENTYHTNQETLTEFIPPKAPLEDDRTWYTADERLDIAICHLDYTKKAAKRFHKLFATLSTV